MSASRGPSNLPLLLSAALTLWLVILGGGAMAAGSSQGLASKRAARGRAILLLEEGKLDLHAISEEALMPQGIEGVTIVSNPAAHVGNLARWISAPAAGVAEGYLTTFATGCLLGGAVSFGITVLLWVQRPRASR